MTRSNVSTIAAGFVLLKLVIEYTCPTAGVFPVPAKRICIAVRPGVGFNAKSAVLAAALAVTVVWYWVIASVPVVTWAGQTSAPSACRKDHEARARRTPAHARFTKLSARIGDRPGIAPASSADKDWKLTAGNSCAARA